MRSAAFTHRVSRGRRLQNQLEQATNATDTSFYFEVLRIAAAGVLFATGREPRSRFSRRLPEDNSASSEYVALEILSSGEVCNPVRRRTFSVDNDGCHRSATDIPYWLRRASM